MSSMIDDDDDDGVCTKINDDGDGGDCDDGEVNEARFFLLADDEEPLDKLTEFTDIHRDIFIAACFGNNQLLARLIPQVDNPFMNNPKAHCETPLHIATLRGNIKTISFLIRRGHPVDPVQFGDYTPLHYAAYFNKKRALEKLLKFGANPYLKTNRGETVFDLPTTSSTIKEFVIHMTTSSTWSPQCPRR